MLCVLALLMMAGGSAADAPFQVIVHRSNPTSSLTRAELSAIYMKRIRSWRGGGEIVAIEQPVRARLRDDFSRAVHGKSVAYVVRYWQRLIFAGRGIPPPEVPSSAAAIDFVRTHRGAIAYVDREVALPDDVKTIVVRR